MISQTLEYALRAMVSLAHHHAQARTAEQLAKDTQVPGMYLSKIMQGLVRAGLVTSQRGPGGGFKLSRDPEEITVWNVVYAVDPFPRIRECPLKLATHGKNLCPLHRKLDDAMGTVEDAFRTTALSELASTRRGVKPLCEAAEG
jgi:Rrf2 family transcriptional regulator, nitric oxide-sensitive transcriptional repressor